MFDDIRLIADGETIDAAVTNRPIEDLIALVKERVIGKNPVVVSDDIAIDPSYTNSFLIVDGEDIEVAVEQDVWLDSAEFSVYISSGNANVVFLGDNRVDTDQLSFVTPGNTVTFKHVGNDRWVVSSSVGFGSGGVFELFDTGVSIEVTDLIPFATYVISSYDLANIFIPACDEECEQIPNGTKYHFVKATYSHEVDVVGTTEAAIIDKLWSKQRKADEHGARFTIEKLYATKWIVYGDLADDGSAGVEPLAPASFGAVAARTLLTDRYVINSNTSVCRAILIDPAFDIYHTRVYGSAFAVVPDSEIDAFWIPKSESLEYVSIPKAAPEVVETTFVYSLTGSGVYRSTETFGTTMTEFHDIITVKDSVNGDSQHLIRGQARNLESSNVPSRFASYTYDTGSGNIVEYPLSAANMNIGTTGVFDVCEVLGDHTSGAYVTANNCKVFPLDPDVYGIKVLYFDTTTSTWSISHEVALDSTQVVNGFMYDNEFYALINDVVSSAQTGSTIKLYHEPTGLITDGVDEFVIRAVSKAVEVSAGRYRVAFFGCDSVDSTLDTTLGRVVVYEFFEGVFTVVFDERFSYSLAAGFPFAAGIRSATFQNGDSEKLIVSAGNDYGGFLFLDLDYTLDTVDVTYNGPDRSATGSYVKIFNPVTV